MLTLVTIGPSHYCEKARWALDRAKVAYVESAHAPLLHWGATRPRYRQSSVPILVTDRGVIGDSAGIVAWSDAHGNAGRKLVPSDPKERDEALALAKQFDTKLGPAVRRLVYFHLFQDLDGLTRIVSARISAHERWLFRAARVGIVAAMRRGMRIDARGVERSEAKIAEVADLVDARLSRGAKYLVGGRFTVADLTFASLFAPLVLAPGYGWPLPTLEECSDSLRPKLEAYQASECGKFVLRMYREHRAS